MKRSAFQRLFANLRRRRRQTRAAIQTELLETRCLLSCIGADTEHDDHDHDAEGAVHAHALYAPGSIIPEEPAEFNLQGSQWPQPGGDGTTVTITYSYSNLLDGNLGGGLSPNQLTAMVEEGLALWASYAPLNFVEVSDTGPTPSDTDYSAGSHPHIRIGHHAIDGQSNVLAHAYYPLGTGLAGDVHFDTGESWTIGNNSGANVDILETFVHEIGHSLGLGHEPSPSSGNPAIMNPFHGSRFTGLGTSFLLQDDINGIQAIYGSNPTGGDPDDQISEATPVVAGTYNGTISDSNDVDMYAITVEAGQEITLQANETAGGLDPRLRLFNANGDLLAENDDTNGLNSEIAGTFNVAGTFYVAVGVFNNLGYDPTTGDGDDGSAGGGDYELVIITSDPNDQISEAETVSNGTFSAAIDHESDVDMYAFSVDAGATATFDVTAYNQYGLDSLLRLFDANGNELAFNDDEAYPTNLDPFLSYTFNTAGTYYIGVSYWENGSYNAVTGDGDYAFGDAGMYDLTITGVNDPSSVGSDVIARLGGSWWVARSNGTSAFTNVYYGAWDPNAGWNNVQTGDFNNDGLTDVVGRSVTGQLWVGINTGSGFNTQLWGYLVPSLNIQSLLVADVDGDGDDDVVGRSDTGSWWVARSNGSSGFTNELWGGWVESAGWSNVMVADLNGDGREDIIGRANNGQWWAAQSTGTSFTTTYWGYWVPSLGWQDIQVADVDGDGDSDLVGRSNTGSWWVARSNGSSFANELWGGWVESAGWDNVMVTDLDGDGNQDIIGQSTNGQWWAARSSGSAFTTEYWGYWVPSGWQDVQVIDVDQDGNIDVVGRDSGNSLWIARSNGSSGFTNELWGGFAGNGWTNVMVGNAGGGSPGATAIIDFDDDDDDTTIFG